MSTFGPADLSRLDAAVLSRAAAVVAMREVQAGARDADIVGLRHDVDDNPGSLQTAVKIARWEHERGYRSTYFILHGTHYWADDDQTLRQALDTIAGYGHEIGIHTNAIAEALYGGGDPDVILQDAIGRLRSFGYPVTGVAAHGDKLCHTAKFVNDEHFIECARPDMGAPDRELAYGGRTLKLTPRPLAHFGLEYETLRLPRSGYLSDSGGAWNVPPHTAALPAVVQLHVLWHPDWWGAAFD